MTFRDRRTSDRRLAWIGEEKKRTGAYSDDDTIEKHRALGHRVGKDMAPGSGEPYCATCHKHFPKGR